MAQIAGVTVPGFNLPEIDERPRATSTGRASDGTNKFYKFRSADREFAIVTTGMSLTTKNSLASALEADADNTVALTPDSHQDLGNGAGVAVNAFWLDDRFRAVKTNHENWTATLRFRYVS